MHSAIFGMNEKKKKKTEQSVFHLRKILINIIYNAG